MLLVDHRFMLETKIHINLVTLHVHDSVMSSLQCSLW